MCGRMHRSRSKKKKKKKKKRLRRETEAGEIDLTGRERKKKTLLTLLSHRLPLFTLLHFFLPHSSPLPLPTPLPPPLPQFFSLFFFPASSRTMHRLAVQSRRCLLSSPACRCSLHLLMPCFFLLARGWYHEADDRQMTTIFTVQPSFHHRHSTNRVSRSVTIVGERRGEV